MYQQIEQPRPSMGSHRVGHNWSELAAAAEEMDKFLETYNFPFMMIQKIWTEIH